MAIGRSDALVAPDGGNEMMQFNVSPEIDQEVTRRLIDEIVADPMGGWVKWPETLAAAERERIKAAAQQIREESECLVCIGIGGSYLGHRAVIEALGNRSDTEIVYAGNSLSQRELDRVLAIVGDRDFSVNVISKSGTTLEPARAFEVFKQKLIEKYGENGAAERIYATTDAARGQLHDEAVQQNYTRFVVPDDIGGRYSVLTAVGLLPIAVAGLDIDALLAGAAEAATAVAFEDSVAVKYAWTRFILAGRHYDTEVFATFEPATAYFNEWLKQLFGESEGKGRRGIFPASVVYSTDLHSLGQFMQDGRRNLLETIIDFPTDAENAKVVEAVKKAHVAGGIPVLELEVPSYDERGFGELIYFFEMSCALSAKLQGVNPFDQPGVEAYKAELRKLLNPQSAENVEDIENAENAENAEQTDSREN